VCIIFVVGYLMRWKIKHYWLMMNLTNRFKIQNGVVSFGAFWGEILLRNKVQLLDLIFWFWPKLIKLTFTMMVQDCCDFVLKYFKPCLSFSWNYSWFMQYMNSDNGDFFNVRLPLGMHFESFHLILVYIFDVNYYVIIWFFFFVLSFVCSCLWFLFTNYMMAFTALKGKKQCLPLRFLFWDDADWIAYLTMGCEYKHRNQNPCSIVVKIMNIFTYIFFLTF
jgi:hypothetical protein